MAPVSFGQPGHRAAQGRGRQPFGHLASQDTGAQRALAGDHQHGAPALRPAAQDKVGERRPRAILVEAMKIDTRSDRFAFDGEAAMPPRFDRLGRLTAWLNRGGASAK